MGGLAIQLALPVTQDSAPSSLIREIERCRSFEAILSLLRHAVAQNPEVLVDLLAMRAIAITLFNWLWRKRDPRIKAGTHPAKEKHLLQRIVGQLVVGRAAGSPYESNCKDTARQVARELATREGRIVAGVIFSLYKTIQEGETT